MYYYMIILAAAVPFVITASKKCQQQDQQLRMSCVLSDTCPTGHSCVDGACHDCSMQPRSCLRSVERCQMLNCGNDEGCYLREEVNFYNGSVFLMLTCAKNNPCLYIDCESGMCVTKVFSDTVPIGQCLPQPSQEIPQNCHSKFSDRENHRKDDYNAINAVDNNGLAMKLQM